MVTGEINDNAYFLHNLLIDRTFYWANYFWADGLMKIFLLATLLFVITTACCAGEFGPHAKVTFKYLDEIRAFSGTVIESPDDKIKVLTCWHGTMGFSNPKTMLVEIFQLPEGNTQLSATIELSVVKSDPDRDVLLLSGPNDLKLQIKKLKLANFSLLKDVKTKSYGYAGTTTLIENDSVVVDYETTTQAGNRILKARAPVVFGMSGGGQVYNGDLYGVQSSGKDGFVYYCPSYQLIRFASEQDN